MGVLPPDVVLDGAVCLLLLLFMVYITGLPVAPSAEFQAVTLAKYMLVPPQEVQHHHWSLVWFMAHFQHTSALAGRPPTTGEPQGQAPRARSIPAM